MEKIPLCTIGELKKEFRYIKPNRYTFLPIFPTKELSEFIGMLLSDGIVNNWGTLAFVNSDESLRNKWCVLLEKLFNKKNVQVIKQTGFKHKKGTYVVRITSTAVIRILRHIGIPMGRSSKQQFHVPAFIRNPEMFGLSKEESLEIQKGFLRMMYTCDGSKPFINKGISWRLWIRFGFSKDENLANNCYAFLDEMKSLLKNFYIETTKIYHYKNRRDFFFNIIRQKSILNFHKYIGYEIKSKQNALEEAVRFIKNYKSTHEKRLELILNFLSEPKTTMEVKNMIGLHFSKTYSNLIKLQQLGEVRRIRENHRSFWIREVMGSG